MIINFTVSSAAVLFFSIIKSAYSQLSSNLPSVLPSSRPELLPALKICRNGAYCTTTSDCTPGNKCVSSSLFSSQCLIDITQYLTENCVADNRNCDVANLWARFVTSLRAPPISNVSYRKLHQRSIVVSSH